MSRTLPAFLMFPTATLAHPGDHTHFGLFHLLTEPDHLAMLAIGAGAAFLVWRRWVRR